MLTASEGLYSQVCTRVLCTEKRHGRARSEHRSVQLPAELQVEVALTGSESRVLATVLGRAHPSL